MPKTTSVVDRFYLDSVVPAVITIDPPSDYPQVAAGKHEILLRRPAPLKFFVFSAVAMLFACLILGLPLRLLCRLKGGATPDRND